MRVVEFLGPPGSGKTSLARELTRSLPGATDLEEAVRSAVGAGGEDGMARVVARLSRSSSSRLWRASYARSTDRFSALARFLEANPLALETVLAAQRTRVERDRGQDMVLGWVLNLMARYRLATEWAQRDWLVLDEGFYQRGVALFSHGFVPEDLPLLTAYLTSIPQPDLVVAVDTPLEICEDRLNQRGWSERVVDLPAEARHAFLSDAVTVTRAISDHLETTRTQVVRVDGTTPIPDSLLTVAATLRD
ncbi:MAG: hypothetical protein WEE53_02400 [Acidimicrobiia bacterium]